MSSSKVSNDPDKPALGGIRVKATILFSDIRGFTQMADSMAAEEAVELLNDYFTRMVDVVLEEQGVLDKYIGDGLMAVFGAPRVQEDDALRAVRAGLAMEQELARMNQEWEENEIEPIVIGVGISTGEVIAGNIGSEKRMDFTVIGDDVNIASRLAKLTKSYGVTILISDSTHQELGEHFVTRPIDRVRIPGRKDPVELIEVLGDTSYQLSEGQKHFSQGIEAYREKNFAAACDFFGKGAETDPLCRIFLARCRTLMEDPPKPDWDGVWALERRELLRI
ncbi:MAG: adenylate/guanylate cyclase domain-containing protein [Acidobacteria bacterium]|nr:adenylate/guanylate cyclase domain-containing protein [Acidobacteriota bacterium]